MRHYDLIIAGGGAAGIMAAGVAASAAEFLKKIRRSAEFFAPALRRFSNAETVEFFRRIGVPLSVERGKRVFPASGKAWDVAEAHIDWCRRQGAEIACLTRVREIQTDGGRIAGATVQTPQGTERIAAPNVLLATGGASYPATGSSGDGYLLAHRLGHTIVEIRPSLTPLVSGLPETDRLKGLALRNVAAKLVVDGETTQQEFGELEFTPFLSGPIVLRMSRRAVDALIEECRVELEIDLKPALDRSKLADRIAREIGSLEPQAEIRQLLRRLLPPQLIPLAAATCRLSPSQLLASLDKRDGERIASVLKSLRIPVSDYRPFSEAIVTAGGVSTEEVDPETMQSRLVGGLYLAGELLDIDADTGGYNLQIAYSTGHLAGELLASQPI
ncbi:NAD(P)/FAD-dependent oxidoreductase [Alistipes ihumii]|uniref:NAD(P)/FAD-dependent oxidoreductase n=2 Tax=Alistipes ihumii TaxID=1470347 RepID=UPI00266608BB|nr:aminoacetone oxidase family FAD-binding enzyme [Alistipes ihumii]